LKEYDIIELGDFMYETDLILDAFEISDELKQSPMFQDVLKSIDRLLKQDETHSLIDNFNREKAKYDEALPHKNYHRDFKAISQRFIEAKTALYTHKDYIDYQQKLQAFNQTLEAFSNNLNDILKSCYIDTLHSCKKV